jgi:hypothetical protein
MSKLISTIAMTIDAVISVSERCVGEGEHDRASRAGSPMRAPCSLVGNLRGPGGALVTSDGRMGGATQRDAEARVIEDWRIDYNTHRGPHSSLGGRARAEFAATWRATQLNLGRSLVGRSHFAASFRHTGWGVQRNIEGKQPCLCR